MNEREQARWNAHVARMYNKWIQTTPEDADEAEVERHRAQDILDARDEWEAECKKDEALTIPDHDEVMFDSGICTLETPEISDEELQWREYFRKDTERHWNREGC